MGLILIVDGCFKMAEACCAALNANGYTAMAAVGVQEALSKCREHRFALVVCDYYLEDGTGHDLLSLLNELEPKPAFIMSTGCGSEHSAAEAMQGGALKYIIRDSAYIKYLPGMVKQCFDELAAGHAKMEQELTLRRLEAQNELSVWLAHNFKNILAASIGFINLVDLTNSEQSLAKQQEYLEESRLGQLKAIDLLEQLIHMTDSKPGLAEPVLIPQLVDEVWSSVRQKVLSNIKHDNPDRFKTSHDKLLHMTFSNHTHKLETQNIVKNDLHVILETLIQNSLEATLNTGQPCITVWGEMDQINNSIVLEVKDNGRGMDEYILKRATDPLFSTKGEVGVGLSLTIANSLVLRQGGNMKLESGLSAGTTVLITLPLKPN